MKLLPLAIAQLFAATSLVLASTNAGTPCLAACTKWSDVLQQCHQTYGISPNIKGYDYSNAFLGCLCVGSYESGTYGNQTMNEAASLCQSCSTTPKEIKADLSTFLTLCAIQATNGTAGNATIWAPLSYITANDPDTGMTAAVTSSGAARVGSGAAAVLAGALAALAVATTI